MDAIEKGLEQHGTRTLQAAETLSAVPAEQTRRVLRQHVGPLEGKMRDLGSVRSTHPTGEPARIPALIMAGRHSRLRRPCQSRRNGQKPQARAQHARCICAKGAPADESEENMIQRAQGPSLHPQG